MKISWRIFIISYCLMVSALALSNFFYIENAYDKASERIIMQAQSDNRNMYAYAATMDKMTYGDELIESLEKLAESMSVGIEKEVFVGSREDLKKQYKDENINAKEKTISCKIEESGKGKYVQVVSRIEDIYIMNRYSLEDAVSERNENLKAYRIIVVSFSTVMAVVLLMFAAYISSPLKYVKMMAQKISTGDYSARIKTDMRTMKSQEIKALGDAMNQMAESTQNNIDNLEAMIQKREIFIGDFTHEIKTPLTSIIGYGDLLRTYKQPEDKTREYGDYIYKEGKRLESLSQNLLQLIVMDNSDLQFSKESALRLFEQIKKSAIGLGDKYGVHLNFDIQDSELNVEYSLITSAIINFIDNACKASVGGAHVYISGNISEGDYVISVKDEGKGIPESELDKITEPFYMVDKSRARSQGGAGLGLALSKKIAELHGAKLDISSVIDEGTTVTLTLRRAQ